MATELKLLETTFGKILRELRVERSLSQEKLALEAGLDRTFISMLERSIRQPSLGTVFALASVLDLAPSALIAIVEKRLARARK
jgi:transcriptional regulator with XRE-family HTH domain